MARARKGSVLHHRGVWYAVLTLDVEGQPGTTSREWVDLGLTDARDRKKAERQRDKLVALAAAGQLFAKAKGPARSTDTNGVLLDAYIESRRVGVSAAQITNWRIDASKRIKPAIGDLTPDATTKAMLIALLETARRDLAVDAMNHLRQLVCSYFADLEEREVIASNPARRLKMPRDVRGRDARPRTLVSDDEFAALLASPAVVDVEIKILAIVSRTLGGQRSAEVNRLDWSGVDRDAFAALSFIRAKKKGKESDSHVTLVVPESVRPFLSLWWRAQGSPVVGPVFPVTKGKRVGQARGRTNYPQRWRRALLAASLDRHELHNDTPTSRKTEWHSLRRAYSTALADAGVNVQHAMHLSGHSDPKVHQRYVMGTEAMRTVPIAALPPMPGDDVVQSLTAIVAAGKRRRVSPERDTGFEPATFSLGS